MQHEKYFWLQAIHCWIQGAAAGQAHGDVQAPAHEDFPSIFGQSERNFPLSAAPGGELGILEDRLEPRRGDGGAEDFMAALQVAHGDGNEWGGHPAKLVSRWGLRNQMDEEPPRLDQEPRSMVTRWMIGGFSGRSPRVLTEEICSMTESGEQ